MLMCVPLLLAKVDPDHLNRIAPLAVVRTGRCSFHLPHVVRIGYANIANSTQNVASYVTVAAGRLACQVVFQSSQPCFGLGLAMLRQHGGHQCRVVRVLARADAQFAFPARIGQIFIMHGRKLLILVGMQHPCPYGQRKPLVVCAAQMRGMAAFTAADFIGCVSPACTRSTRAPTSTVISTSAGERLPSAFTRSNGRP